MEIKIHSVGMRDGLQMEKTIVPTAQKIKWINSLVEAGVDIIQIGSFVHKDRMPQMADTDELFEYFKTNGKPQNVIFSGLALNEKGVERAINCDVDMICIGVSASETHSQKNTKMNVNEATTRITSIAKEIIQSGKFVQASVQSAFGCGFEGKVPEEKVYSIIENYISCGIRNISLADTAGFANPQQVERMYAHILEMDSTLELACHFHNTKGLGIANCYAAMKAGVKYFETAFAGLGGCPFTKLAAGNVATEDFVSMLQEMGLKQNIRFEVLIDLANEVETFFARTLPGYVYKIR